ncbi:PepSY domain-containing protein [Streptomyces boncukensis]|uniref:PepSY domain-containing protein n=1 Tax=Streptomyces boncukensis TaxID=2711219 RepID=A0A6G4X6V0_9ACTN|nr:PepSY domain-containing protein [Streptomyces boncukensis]NGO73245.1 PepSY domain-containing protein [Streptomyces boncukensis]
MKRKVIIAGAAAAALLTTGTVTALAAGGGSDASRAEPASPALAASSDVRSGDGDAAEDTGRHAVSAQRAATAAAKAAPGTVAELELDTDDGKLVWEADVFGRDSKWYDIDIDPEDGKVSARGLAHDDDREPVRKVKVDAAGAAAKAAGAGKGVVTSVDLEGTHWEVETTDSRGTEHELLIDADSGKIVQHAAGGDDGDRDGDGDDGDGD